MDINAVSDAVINYEFAMNDIENAILFEGEYYTQAQAVHLRDEIEAQRTHLMAYLEDAYKKFVITDINLAHFKQLGMDSYECTMNAFQTVFVREMKYRF